MDAGKLGLLDNLRFSNGPEGLKNYFRELLRVDRDSALSVINDNDTRFGTLYLLKSELPEKLVQNDLNPLYRKALDLAGSLTGKVSPKIEGRIRKSGEDTAFTLRWIIRTGLPEDGLGNRYEQLMERAAALLVKSFGDTSVLPELVEMIFERNRRGALLRELVWAFFEARCPESLRLVAKRLESMDKRDVELAKKLLCFIPGISDNAPTGATGIMTADAAGSMKGNMERNMAKETARNISMNAGDGLTGAGLHTIALNWLEENQQFLYYTGESMHLCSMPQHYRVSWSAKYMCRSVSVDNGQPLLEYQPAEIEILSRFENLPETLQKQLADYSHIFYKRNISQWNAWIRLPVKEQAAAASLGMEGWI
ncbi:MAG: hypothetical protein ACOYJ1_13280 [Peptococcales bacterium]|jgi:hypothetical protein